MNDFVRPELIPGAGYDVEVRAGRVEIWIYCPTHDGDPEPWLVPDPDNGVRASWAALPDEAIIHGDGPVYNPHESTESGTRWEWGYGEVDGPFHGPYPEEKVRRLVAAHTFTTGNSDWHIFRREVRTTKWKQIVS